MLPRFLERDPNAWPLGARIECVVADKKHSRRRPVCEAFAERFICRRGGSRGATILHVNMIAPRQAFVHGGVPR
jgi:hypothetical protein